MTTAMRVRPGLRQSMHTTSCVLNKFHWRYRKRKGMKQGLLHCPLGSAAIGPAYFLVMPSGRVYSSARASTFKFFLEAQTLR